MKYDFWKTQRDQAKTVYNGMKVLCGDSFKGKPGLYVWRPRATNPSYNYYFNSLEERGNYLKKILENYDKEQTQKKQWKDERKFKPEVAKSLKVRDLYYDSWGYDQTNYDYIAVLEISPTGKTVICQRTGYKHNGTSGCLNLQRPVYSPFGDKFRLQVKTGKYGISLVGSYPFCHDGKGSKREGSFNKVEDGRDYYETDSQFGH